jgi:hypothetical protein
MGGASGLQFSASTARMSTTSRTAPNRAPQGRTAYSEYRARRLNVETYDARGKSIATYTPNELTLGLPPAEGPTRLER